MKRIVSLGAAVALVMGGFATTNAAFAAKYEACKSAFTHHENAVDASVGCPNTNSPTSPNPPAS